MISASVRPTCIRGPPFRPLLTAAAGQDRSARRRMEPKTFAGIRTWYINERAMMQNAEYVVSCEHRHGGLLVVANEEATFLDHVTSLSPKWLRCLKKVCALQSRTDKVPDQAQ